MRKLTKVNPKESKGSILTSNTPRKNQGVVISFKYLDKYNVACLEKLSKYDRTNREEHVFKKLETFLYEAEECNNVEEMIKLFTSNKGSIIDSSNPHVKKIIDSFKDNYPNDKGILSNRLIHIHVKRNGKDKMVIFGVNYQSTFYILGIDPNHDFNK